MVITGRLAALAVLGVVPILLRPEWSTVWALVALLAIVAMLDAAWAASVRGQVLTRSGDDRVRLGETASVRLRISNPTSRRLRGVVRDAWVPSAGASPRTHTVVVPPGEARTVTTQLMPTRRGDRPADRVTIRSLGPLGIAGRQGTHQVSWTVRSLPPFASRRILPSRLARLRDLDGRSPLLIRGQGTEFDTLREYVPGDDVRSIDWRATARTADVMVRTWRPERDRRVVLVLDTGRTAAARVGDAPRLDAAMEAALLLGVVADRAGDRVDLLAHDTQLRAQVSGSTGAVLLNQMVEALATVDPRLVETDASAMVGVVNRRHRQRSFVVLLTSLDPASLTAGLLPVIDVLVGRHHVVVASVADDDLDVQAAERGTTDAVYAAASAERARTDRLRVSELLRRRGVDVVDATAEHLPAALTDHYLTLKATGRL